MSKHDQDNWEKHWDDFAEFTAINPAPAYRRRLIIKQLRKIHKPAMKVLDLGSGQGDLIAALTPLFPTTQFYGAELSKKGVDISRKKVPSAHFSKMDLLSKTELIPDVLQNGVDAAICSEVLEHLDDPLELLINIRHLLKNEARLIITVPSGPRSAYDRHLGHRKHFSSQDLKTLLEKSGYDVETILRAGFPFFNLYKILVILRGKRTINDSSQKRPPRLISFAIRCFDFLLKANLDKTPWGWQLVAVAKYHKSPDKVTP